jgi:hypothetical protein
MPAAAVKDSIVTDTGGTELGKDGLQTRIIAHGVRSGFAAIRPLRVVGRVVSRVARAAKVVICLF